jgi:16S rRNA processing protein RimM
VTRPRIRLLEAASEVTVAGRRHAIVKLGGTAQRPVLTITGSGSREQAEALRGQDLLVDREQSPELGEDEWLAEDLVGCSVGDGERRIGVVKALLPYPSCDLLEVHRAGGEPVLVPLIGDAVRTVDIASRTIDVDLSFLGLEDDGAA